MICEAPDNLRSEGNFRDEDDGRFPEGNRLPDCFNIDMRLPASGDTVQEERPESSLTDGFGKRVEGCDLVGVRGEGLIANE
jgi:hypothetical protein